MSTAAVAVTAPALRSLPSGGGSHPQVWRAYHHHQPAAVGGSAAVTDAVASETGFGRGGDDETTALVERHLPLVRHVVGRMKMNLPPHVEAEELHSVGVAGLMTAVRKYDPAQGNTFQAYANICIRGAVLDELRRMDWLSRGVRGKAKRLKDTISELEQRHGRAVTEEEIRGELDLSAGEYADLLDEVRPVSFVPLDGGGDEDANGGEEGSLHDAIADAEQASAGEQLARKELLELVTRRVQQLPDMQRKVLAMYYFEDMRLAEIAEVFGLTESRICQIHSQAVFALRGYVERISR